MEVLKMKDIMSSIVKIVALVLILIVLNINVPKDIGPHSEYECDVNNLRLSTDITISKDDEKIPNVPLGTSVKWDI